MTLSYADAAENLSRSAQINAYGQCSYPTRMQRALYRRISACTAGMLRTRVHTPDITSTGMLNKQGCVACSPAAGDAVRAGAGHRAAHRRVQARMPGQMCRMSGQAALHQRLMQGACSMLGQGCQSAACEAHVLPCVACLCMCKECLAPLGRC